MRMVLMAAAGGAIGAAGRYLFSVGAMRLLGHGFPWATVVVNILGSFILGLFISLVALKLSVSNEVRTFVATGILGGFTTFSAFSLDMATLIERDQGTGAMFYLFSSVSFSVVALFAGLYIVRILL